MLALIAIALLTRSVAISQATPTGTGPVSAQRFEAGLQFGPGVSWLRGNKVTDETGLLPGPAAALTVQYNLSSILGIRLGAGYQLKGSSTDVSFSDINGNVLGRGTVRYELPYLHAPLMLRIGFGRRWRVNAGVGGYAAMLMSAKLTSKGSDIPEQAVTDDFERFDLGICASVGGSLVLGERFGLNAEVRYEKGLTNISALPVVGDGSIRTNAVCLLMGCGYRFGSTL